MKKLNGIYMNILKQDGIPLYHQLKEIFYEKIDTGEWKAGETIPNELTLCEQFQVSRGPVRQALDQLVREGLLKRKQGKGTEVLPPKIESNLRDFSSFTALIQKRGMRPGVRLLEFDKVLAHGSVARNLNLVQEEACFKIRRLRLADEEPLILETVFVPHSISIHLDESDITTRSLYEILIADYGVVPQRAKQFFEPAIADEYEGQELSIAKGAPVLLIENITLDVNDRPIVFSKAIMRGDRVRYYVELSTQIFGAF
jgi:GntR family transcriptional regulator